MARIRLKKPVYPVSEPLYSYLRDTRRESAVPIAYQDLLHHNSSAAVYDRRGEDTLWETLYYRESERQYIYDCLRTIYAQLKVGGDVSVIEHLYVDRVDYCMYANTHPIRVRIVNRLNDLFDYFYIKQADMSRIFGMELEHLLSPYKIHYLVHGNTMIEEHIQGVPGDIFIRDYLSRTDYNPLRVAKEFVKFNERCLVQLLGDMRNDNYVVEVIPDFDELYFRLRAIDFDQHAHEGSAHVYLPQFFKENNPIIMLGLNAMSEVLELQYQREERMRLLTRLRAAGEQIERLLRIMRNEPLSTPENIQQLRSELVRLYKDPVFMEASSMGEIVTISLQLLERYPVRARG